jgi:hypothetical protein
MKEQQIQGIISGIRDEFILEAEPKALAALLPETDPVAGTVILSSPAEGSRRKTRGKAKRWIPLIVAAAVTLTVGLNLGLYAGMNALLGQGGALLPSTPSGGNPLGGLLGGLFPFLSPDETEPPYEVTVRDPEDATEPPDTRTECEKGNHQWEITDYEQATCYLVSPVTHTCSLCGETKRESDYRPHAYEDGICTVCGMDIGYPDAPPHQHTWVNSQCTGCLEWCNEDLSHTFVGNTCSNCGCTYGGEDHYIYLGVEGLYEDIESDIYYHIHYSYTLNQFLESIKNFYNPIDFAYYLIDRNNTSRTIKIDQDTVIGEFGSSLTLFADRHYHSWSDGVCIDCGYECPHPKADDFCPECGMENPYHLITIMYNGVEYKLAAGFELSTFVERIVENGVWFDDAAVLGYWVFETEDSYKVIYMHDAIEQSGTLIYIERTGEIDPNYCSHNWRDSDYCKFCGGYKKDFNR